MNRASETQKERFRLAALGRSGHSDIARQAEEILAREWDGDQSGNALRIALIGNLAVDVHVFLKGAFPLENVQEHFPANVVVGPGGCVYNLTRALGRLSTAGEIFSLFADDAEGQFLLSQLQQENLSTKFLLPLLQKNNKTVLLVNDAGEKKMFSDRAPLPDLRVICDEFAGDLQAFRHAHVSPNPWSVMLAEVLSEAGDVSLSADLHVDFDLASYPGFLQRLRIVFFSAVGQAEVRGRIGEYLRLGPEVAICTDGERGCYVGRQNGEEIRHYPAFRQSEPVVDTVGAGDVFAATFLHYYYSGAAMDEAVIKAQLQAGKSCTQYGLNGLYSAEELEWQFAQSHPSH